MKYILRLVKLYVEIISFNQHEPPSLKVPLGCRKVRQSRAALPKGVVKRLLKLGQQATHIRECAAVAATLFDARGVAGRGGRRGRAERRLEKEKRRSVVGGATVHRKRGRQNTIDRTWRRGLLQA